jgi:hypothetical protein
MSRTGITPDGIKRQVGLENAVKAWSTPQSRDWKDQGTEAAHGDYSPSLGRQVLTMCAPGQKSSPNALKLNPLFVEWLQGFPADWTVCDALATPLSRKPRRRGPGRRSKREEIEIPNNEIV